MGERKAMLCMCGPLPNIPHVNVVSSVRYMRGLDQLIDLRRILALANNNNNNNIIIIIIGNLISNASNGVGCVRCVRTHQEQ